MGNYCLHVTCIKYNKLLAIIHQYKQVMAKMIQNADLLLRPVTATPDRVHSSTQDHLEDFSYTMRCSVMASAALSLPCGYSKQQLSIEM